MTAKPYRGRLAPSPTGYLHLGHAYTFWTAQERAETRNGVLVFRNEDLDQPRCKPEFLEAICDDLEWLGIAWSEGFRREGEHGPYSQSHRRSLYEQAFAQLKARDLIYPCTCTRQDVLRALSAPHDGNDEPIYAGTCRTNDPKNIERANWRFCVRPGMDVNFTDGRFGSQTFTAGKHFGDFVVWRQDNWPSYQLAVVIDDAAMKISEVVRGSDLLLSTARQLLLYDALDLAVPEFYHTPVICDESGAKLSKRDDAIGIRKLRERGFKPEHLRAWWQGSRQVFRSADLLKA